MRVSQAVKSIEDDIGRVMELSVVVDDRGFPRRYGFLIELDGPHAHTACRRLQEQLSSMNDSYARFSSDSKVGEPSVRIMAGGTFSAYRSRRIRVSGGGSVQMKIPTVVYNPEVRNRLAECVVMELGDEVKTLA